MLTHFLKRKTIQTKHIVAIVAKIRIGFRLDLLDVVVCIFCKCY